MEINQQNQSLIDPDEEMWTHEQLAEFLNMSPATIYNWIQYDHMGPPYVKSGNLIRYFKSDVIDWLKSSYFDRQHFRGPDDRPPQIRIHDKMLQFWIGINQLCELVEDSEAIPDTKSISRFQKYYFTSELIDELTDSEEGSTSILEDALTLAAERVFERTHEHLQPIGRVSPKMNRKYYRKFMAKQRQKEKSQ